ncbi:TPM domain-containing protein [Clostridium sp.]|uniref:TPM domain-containing protein n=1 Tax=Clostridium sp. TaxID=1506 RepID=UPI003F2CC662
MKIKNKFLRFLTLFVLLISFSFSIFVFAADNIETPTSYKYINDYVGIMDNESSKNIISIGKELEDKTGAQAVVVIVDSTKDVPIEDYANKLFRSWGIGQKGKDNGLLILLALNDRQWRVEVGRGLEGAIPDALSNRIMESIAKPNFKEENYAKGLTESYSTFSDSIANEYGVTLNKSLNISLPAESGSSSGGGIAISIIVVLILLDLIFNRGRIFSTLLQIAFWSNIGRGNGPRGGSGGSGSGGGGFGGFGGGSSNGGGSSGSW